MKDAIKIGDTVTYRGSWGNNAPKEAKVEYIEKCEEIGSKDGISVQEINVNDKDYCVFDLNDGHWCYGYQIDIK